MKFADLLSCDCILADMSAQTKPEALSELAGPVTERFPQLDGQTVFSVLMDRENFGTTAMGDGVAIPHGRLPGIDGNILVIGRSHAGIDFGAADGNPCHIFFMILTPEGKSGQHLRLLAMIAKKAKDSLFRSDFMNAPNDKGLLDFLADE